MSPAVTYIGSKVSLNHGPVNCKHKPTDKVTEHSTYLLSPSFQLLKLLTCILLSEQHKVFSSQGKSHNI